jgi:phage minor structural protein
MSFPILYDANLTGWKDGTLGLGVLSDAISCVVEEERNSTYELEMEYPISGIHVDDIEKGTCLYVTHDNSGEKQLFEVYSVTKNLTKMTVNARHISYRLNKATVLPCSADALATAMVALKGHSIGADNFSFDACERTVSAPWSVKYPLSVRSALGGVSGSLLDTYTGEYEWDNFTVKLHTKRGSNNGVTIEYAKNLTSLEAEEDAGDIFTSCIPYYKCQDDTYFYLESPVKSDYTGDYTMCAPFDMTENFTAPDGAADSWHPTAAQLKSAAESYMSENKVGIAKSNLTVDFVDLWQSEEYKNIAPLQEVKLCDTVTVRYPKFNVDITTKVISVKWDVLAEKYTSIELGEAKSGLSSTIVTMAKEATENSSTLEAEFAYIKGKVGNFEDVYAKTAYVDELAATKANVSDLSAAEARIGTLETGKADIATLNAVDANLKNLIADKADITELDAAKADITTLNADVSNLKTAKIDKAEVTTLLADKADIDLANIEQGCITQAMIGNGAIGSAQILDNAVTNEKVQSLSASKLTAGTIDAKNINVKNLSADEITTGKLNVGGLTIDVDEKTTSLDGSAIKDGTVTLSGLSQEVKDEIDGAIQTWTATTTPTVDPRSYPTTEWDATEDAKHIGDVCYVQNGHSYRFYYDNTAATYSWELIKDSDVTKALADIQQLDGEVTSFKTEYNSFKDETDSGMTSLRTRTTTIETTYSTKEYADNAADAAETAAKADATAKVNSALSSAKSYTDSATEDMATTSDVSGAVSTAKSYTDTATKDMATTTDVANAKSAAISTASADATTKANQAKADAISAAADDATEKADAAKADAISTAATDATTKADAALSDAKDYTDTKVSTKVETSTFNELKNTVDENSATITTLSTSKADASDVETLSNTVNSVKQTADTNTASISTLQSTVENKADSSTVSTLSTKVNSIEQTANGNTSRVTALETKTSNMATTDDVATAKTAAIGDSKTYTDSQITQTSSSLTAKITEETTKAVEGIVVGGRNLIKGTEALGDTQAGTLPSNVTFSQDTDGFTQINWAAASSLAVNLVSLLPAQLLTKIKGREVTFSCMVKSADYASLDTSTTTGVLFRCTTDSGKYIQKTMYTEKLGDSDWHKLKWTFDATEASFTSGSGSIVDSTKFYMQVGNYSLYRIDVKQPILEFGNVASDWSPAPEDYGEQIERLSDDAALIKQTAENAQHSADDNATAIAEVKKDYESKITASASDLRLEFSETTTTANKAATDAASALQKNEELTTSVSSMIRASSEGVEIGSSDSDYSSLTANDGYYIKYKGSRQIWLTAENANIKKPRLLAPVEITDDDNGWIISISSDGSLLINRG